MVGHKKAKNQPVSSIECHDIMRITCCVLVKVTVVVVVVAAAALGENDLEGFGRLVRTEVERGDPRIRDMITITTAAPPPPAADDRERKEETLIPEELQVGTQ